MNGLAEYETPEIRLIRAIYELNARILNTDTADRRERLRASIATLRAELIHLIEDIAIATDHDFQRAHQAQGLVMSTLPTSGGFQS